jgi:hypothetical protein
MHVGYEIPWWGELGLFVCGAKPPAVTFETSLPAFLGPQCTIGFSYHKAKINISQTFARVCCSPRTLKTPTSANGLARMRDTIDEVLSAMTDEKSRLHVQKLYNAAEQSLANCALLTDENKSLVEQNCEKKARQAVRATIPGPAKIMTYEDIVLARRAQVEKEAGVATRKRKRAAKSLPETTGKSAHEAEVAVAELQIAAAGLSEHCGVLVYS